MSVGYCWMSLDNGLEISMSMVSLVLDTGNASHLDAQDHGKQEF